LLSGDVKECFGPEAQANRFEPFDAKAIQQPENV
jgi:hypothetical protein